MDNERIGVNGYRIAEAMVDNFGGEIDRQERERIREEGVIRERRVNGRRVNGYRRRRRREYFKLNAIDVSGNSKIILFNDLIKAGLSVGVKGVIESKGMRGIGEVIGIERDNISNTRITEQRDIALKVEDRLKVREIIERRVKRGLPRGLRRGSVGIGADIEGFGAAVKREDDRILIGVLLIRRAHEDERKFYKILFIRRSDIFKACGREVRAGFGSDADGTHFPVTGIASGDSGLRVFPVAVGIDIGGSDGHDIIEVGIPFRVG